MDSSSTQEYFERNRQFINVNFAIAEDSSQVGLRAQAGAYWAVKGHFTRSDAPAIVVMPTGSGKTGVMTLLGLSLAKKRILIIVPSRIVQDQIHREFTNLSIVHLVNKEISSPKVHSLRHQLSSLETWNDLAKYDVVIATPKCISPAEQNVYDTPPLAELFDCILFDEGHHLPATTWESLFKRFSVIPAVRIITFTATPFRTDRKAIPGEIVYDYPVSLALKAGIYRQIEFVPVTSLGDSPAEKNEALAEEAAKLVKDIFASEKNIAKIIVRVDRKEDTENLQTLYREKHGLNLEIITSDQSSRLVDSAIEKVRNDDSCHGLIAVDMMGEGFDLPNLRIGVMHSAFQSFPVTLQFIGRLCRVSAKSGSGNSKLLAIPKDIESHTRELYQLDGNWQEIISNFADAAVEEEKLNRRFFRSWTEKSPQLTYEQILERDVSPQTLKPFYSARIYTISKTAKIDFEELASLQLPKTAELVKLFSESIGSAAYHVLITKSRAKPLWSTSNALQEITYDLHVYYYNDELLFESTTSEKIATLIRKYLNKANAQLRPIAGNLIEQILSQAGDSPSFFTIGAKRTGAANSSIPQYTVMSGKRAEDAMRGENWKLFAHSHVLGKFQWNTNPVTMGASWDNSTAWLMSRDNLRKFAEWCDWLTASIKGSTQHRLKHLETLNRAEVTDYLTARPFAAEFNTALYLSHIANNFSLEIRDNKNNRKFYQDIYDVDVKVDQRGWQVNQPSTCTLILCVGKDEIKVRYDASNPTQTFEVLKSTDCETIKFHFEQNGKRRSLELAQYFEEFPPTIYLINGDAVIGNQIFRYTNRRYDLPVSIMLGENWSKYRCDTTIEDHNMVRSAAKQKSLKSGNISVLQATQSYLTNKYTNSGGIVLFCDHKSGEIADYIAIFDGDNQLHIHMFHCKASQKKTPGARLEDAYEVLGQCIKCTKWINSNFFEVISPRLTQASLILGSSADFDALKTRYSPQTTVYKVHAVQPGFSQAKITKDTDPSLRTLIISVNEILQGQNIEFEIVGS